MGVTWQQHVLQQTVLLGYYEIQRLDWLRRALGALLTSHGLVLHGITALLTHTHDIHNPIKYKLDAQL